MLDYSLLKVIHIISATLLFGTGLGTFFFMVKANRGGHVGAIRETAKTVVLADWLFTTPAVLIQFVTGLLLMQMLGFSFTSGWFLAVLGLFLFVGCLWLPVVWIQIQLRGMVKELPDDGVLPVRFVRLARIWEWLGYPAFGAVVVVFILMVYKPWLV